MKQLHQGAKWVFRIRIYISLFFLIVMFASFFFPIAMSLSQIPFFDSFFASLVPFTLFWIIMVVVLGEVYSRLAYKNWKYELTSHEIKLERGIIWKRYSAIPFERVQNIDIQRGILARMLGFSTLNIQTAGYHMAARGGAVSEGYIPAVSVKDAEEMRDFLIKKIGKRQGL